MGEGRSIWVGKDEHQGVLAQPRKDLRPPPHWRLEAVARTPRPRSLTISADRRSAAFIEDRQTSDVWLVDLEAGSAPERLTTGRDPMPYWEDSSPQLSPDGATVAYADDGHVWLVPTAGGPPRRLAEGDSPRWIDDARLVISVERDDATTTRLAVVNVDDPWPRRLAVSHGELDAHGDEGQAVPSPDGTEVAYTFTPRADQSRSSEIRVAAVEGGAVRRLTGVPDMHDGEPAWAPDGETIAYTSERSGFHELHLVGSDGASDRQLTSAGADHAQHEWHPDGTRLVAVRGERNRFGLVVVDASDGAAELLARGGTWSSPHWTADGGLVASYEDHATPRELRRLTPGDEPSTFHAPAPKAVRWAPHAELEDVTYTSFDGLEIPAFLMRPRDASAERPVPAVVYPHGGPDRLLRRRVGRARAVLRGQGLRLARDQLPRLDRLRARLRAEEPRRVGRGRHEGLPRRRGLPANARLGGRRAPGDLRRELRLLHGAARGDRRSRAPLPLRGAKVRRLRHHDLVGAGRPQRRAGPRAHDGHSGGGARGVHRRLSVPPPRADRGCRS